MEIEGKHDGDFPDGYVQFGTYHKFDSLNEVPRRQRSGVSSVLDLMEKSGVNCVALLSNEDKEVLIVQTGKSHIDAVVTEKGKVETFVKFNSLDRQVN